MAKVEGKCGVAISPYGGPRGPRRGIVTPRAPASDRPCQPAPRAAPPRERPGAPNVGDMRSDDVRLQLRRCQSAEAKDGPAIGRSGSRTASGFCMMPKAFLNRRAHRIVDPAGGSLRTSHSAPPRTTRMTAVICGLGFLGVAVVICASLASDIAGAPAGADGEPANPAGRLIHCEASPSRTPAMAREIRRLTCRSASAPHAD